MARPILIEIVVFTLGRLALQCIHSKLSLASAYAKIGRSYSDKKCMYMPIKLSKLILKVEDILAENIIGQNWENYWSKMIDQKDSQSSRYLSKVKHIS